MRRRVEENPATRKKDWFPKGIHPDLDALHSEHNELIERCEVAQTALSDLRNAFEQEDADRVDAFRRGEEFEVTPEAERKDAFDEAVARFEGTQQALADFVDRAVETVQADLSDLLSSFADAMRSAEDKRTEAARLLAEADQEVAAVEHSRDWIERTARDRKRWHISFEELPVRTPMPGRPSEFATLTKARAGE